MKKVFDVPQSFIDFNRYIDVMLVLGFSFIGTEISKGKEQHIGFSKSKKYDVEAAERITRIFYPKNTIVIGELPDMTVVILSMKPQEDC